VKLKQIVSVEACQRKFRHDTLLSAQQEQTRQFGLDIRLEILECGFCDGWHLGHLSSRRKTEELRRHGMAARRRLGAERKRGWKGYKKKNRKF
jgi:hypothetical protein